MDAAAANLWRPTFESERQRCRSRRVNHASAIPKESDEPKEHAGCYRLMKSKKRLTVCTQHRSHDFSFYLALIELGHAAMETPKGSPAASIWSSFVNIGAGGGGCHRCSYLHTWNIRKDLAPFVENGCPAKKE
jgi:hypothetical protein